MNAKVVIALQKAMSESNTTKEEVARISREHYGKDKLNELTQLEQWTLIHFVYEDAASLCP